jgi:5'-nucleotidase (lipoprotein e(P4) family)
MEWTARVVCDTVPGALSFLKYAASRGVQVFYITNRLEAERTATLANLQKWNFPFSDNDHLLMKTNLSSKDERRALVAARYSILLFLGDNLGDFTGIYDHQEYKKRNALVENHAPDFGRQFIVLPNSMYGEWEGAVLNFNNKLSSEKQNDAVLKRLKNY